MTIILSIALMISGVALISLAYLLQYNARMVVSLAEVIADRIAYMRLEARDTDNDPLDGHADALHEGLREALYPTRPRWEPSPHRSSADAPSRAPRIATRLSARLRRPSP